MLSPRQFRQFIYPSVGNALNARELSALSMRICLHICSSAAPAAPAVPGSASGHISLAVLQECYLPLAANTSMVRDNAHLAMVLEALVHICVRAGQRCDAASLCAAITKGNRAREGKIAGKVNRRKESGLLGQEEDWLLCMRQCGSRMLQIVDMVTDGEADEDGS